MRKFARVFTHQKLLNMIEKKLEALKPMDSELEIFLKFYDLANDYFKEIQNSWEIAECQGTLKQIMYKHLKPGKVVIISYKNHYNKLTIILSAKQMVFEVMILVNNFSQPPKINLNLCMEKFNEIDTQIILCEKEYKVMQTESKSLLNFGLNKLYMNGLKKEKLDETLRDVKTAANRIGNLKPQMP